MPIGVHLSPEKRAEIVSDVKNGIKKQLVASKHKLAQGTVERIVREARARSAPTPTATAPALRLPPAVPAVAMSVGRSIGSGKYGHLTERMKTLHDQGYSYSEIAKKLNMIQPNGKATVAAIGYYLHARDKRKLKKTTEGVSQNGHEQLDTKFLVGFGCAELERTLTAIAQRLGIAPNLLRQGFSKFLGSAAVR